VCFLSCQDPFAPPNAQTFAYFLFPKEIIFSPEQSRLSFSTFYRGDFYKVKTISVLTEDLQKWIRLGFGLYRYNTNENFENSNVMICSVDILFQWMTQRP
jgi:hypothetical protein